MSKVAFVGLGRMGSAMAQRLLGAGHQVRLYNRTAARATPLVGNGATMHASVKEACTGVDAIISMVSDDAASRAVWFADDGVLAAELAPDTLAIECSTLSYEWVLELSTAVTARGMKYVDAPVTGIPTMAAAGELTMLVGADSDDLQRAQPLLTAFSRQTIHFGRIGAGTAYKLIVNLLGAVQIASLAESIAIAERAGLDLQSVANALTTGQAASPQIIRHAPRMAADDHDDNVSFTPELRIKDVRYALQLAQRVGIDAPFGELAYNAYERLLELGHSQVNESKIIEVARTRVR